MRREVGAGDRTWKLLLAIAQSHLRDHRPRRRLRGAFGCPRGSGAKSPGYWPSALQAGL